MGNLPLVSICIPTYNGGEHFFECIKSIQCQTFSKFEVVICDDQSSDGTFEYAQSIAIQDSRFRAVLNPVRYGLVGNWNNCIKNAKGEWIKLAFQDDILQPECVEKLLDACTREGKRFSFCRRDFIFDESVQQGKKDWFNQHKATIEACFPNRTSVSPREAAEQIMRDPALNIVGEPTLTLINRAVFKELGYFEEALIQLCDAEFWSRVLSNEGGAIVAESLASFRIHAAAATSENLKNRQYRTYVLDHLVLKYFLAFGVNFAQFRSHKYIKVVWLKMRCCSEASWAFDFARVANLQGNPSPMREWQLVAAAVPQLNSLRKWGKAINLVLTIPRWIRKTRI